MVNTPALVSNLALYVAGGASTRDAGFFNEAACAAMRATAPSARPDEIRTLTSERWNIRAPLGGLRPPSVAHAPGRSNGQPPVSRAARRADRPPFWPRA